MTFSPFIFFFFRKCSCCISFILLYKNCRSLAWRDGGGARQNSALTGRVLGEKKDNFCFPFQVHAHSVSAPLRPCSFTETVMRQTSRIVQLWKCGITRRRAVSLFLFLYSKSKKKQGVFLIIYPYCNAIRLYTWMPAKILALVFFFSFSRRFFFFSKLRKDLCSLLYRVCFFFF